MTLGEAIEHCNEKIDNTQCGFEHIQLRDWLIELRTLKRGELKLSFLLFK